MIAAMRITENTPDRLVIQDRPYLSALLLWVAGAASLGFAWQWRDDLAAATAAGAFGALLILVAWRCLPMITIEFDRAASRVTRRATRITGLSEQRMPLVDVTSAGVKQGFFSTAGIRRLALNPKGRAFFLEYGLASMRRRRMAQDINRWLGGAY